MATARQFNISKKTMAKKIALLPKKRGDFVRVERNFDTLKRPPLRAAFFGYSYLYDTKQI